MLKLKATLSPIAETTHHNEWGHITYRFEVSAQFLSRPDLPMLGLKGCPPSGLGVDFGKALATTWEELTKRILARSITLS